MPKRDGFPTNRELQVDFTAASRDVFVAAAERELEAKISLRPAFEGKPLDHLSFAFYRIYRIYRINEYDTGLPQAVRSEWLTVQPLRSSATEGLRYTAQDKGEPISNEIFRDASDDVIEHYKSLARVIGATTITDDLRFGQLPPEGVEANWVVELGKYGQQIKHVDTFSERPSRQNLVAARFLVEEAARYVQSDDFEKEIARMNHTLGRGYIGSIYGLHHRFSFNVSPDLPINGHESRRFIKDYSSAMERRRSRALVRLDRLIELDAPKMLIDDLEAIISKTGRARDNARKFLDE